MAGLKVVPSTALTANDSTHQEELGSLRIESDGKIYRYIGTSSTCVKGDVMAYRSSNNWHATRVHSLARRNAFAGAGIGAITATYYGWVQCGGYCNYLYTTCAVAAGDGLTLASASNRCVRDLSNTAGLKGIGWTVRADSGCILTSCMLCGNV